MESLIQIFLEDVSEDEREDFKYYINEHSLNLLIRTMMGLDKQAVREAFVEIERRHRLSVIQVKFLKEIVESLSQRGILGVRDIYDGHQFKNIHDGGIDAVFDSERTDKVFEILGRINQGVG